MKSGRIWCIMLVLAGLLAGCDKPYWCDMKTAHNRMREPKLFRPDIQKVKDVADHYFDLADGDTVDMSGYIVGSYGLVAGTQPHWTIVKDAASEGNVGYELCDWSEDGPVVYEGDFYQGHHDFRTSFFSDFKLYLVYDTVQLTIVEGMCNLRGIIRFYPHEQQVESPTECMEVVYIQINQYEEILQ